jgi:ligand-binding sensor domain-containing protein
MSQMINRAGELIRINVEKNFIEYSSNNGKVWHRRSGQSHSMGTLHDLMDSGDEILVTTSKGLYYSSNEGKVWHRRS